MQFHSRKWQTDSIVFFFVNGVVVNMCILIQPKGLLSSLEQGIAKMNEHAGCIVVLRHVQTIPVDIDESKTLYQAHQDDWYKSASAATVWYTQLIHLMRDDSWIDRDLTMRFELRWERSYLVVNDNRARSKGNLNRNSYCSWSHLSQSDSKQWNEMRGREEWVWGGGEWGGGRCCCWWLLVFCIVPLCSLFFVFVDRVIDFSCLCEDYA